MVSKTVFCKIGVKGKEMYSVSYLVENKNKFHILEIKGQDFNNYLFDLKICMVELVGEKHVIIVLKEGGLLSL